MTLREKYTIKNKKRFKQFICFYSMLCIMLVVYLSMARYKKTSEGYAKIDIANWKIEVNEQQLTSDNNYFKDEILLFPDTNIDLGNPYKILPGQTGHFDIKIDPTDTEVSIAYEIKINLEESKLSEKIKIEKYSINGGTEQILENHTVSSSIILNQNGKFTESDIQTIRFFWKWEQEVNTTQDYEVVADVQLKQIL